MPLVRRRRPLLRAAAVGGGAYMAGKQRARTEAEEAAAEASAQPVAAPAEPAGGLSPDAIEQLKSLAQLHDQGVLTDEEFDAQKAKVLGR